MTSQKIYRKADISTAEARESLKRAYPGAKIAGLEIVVADDEASKAARVKVGSLVYEATVHVADFPPDANVGGSGSDDAPEPPKKDDGGDDSSDDSDSGDDSDGDDGGDAKPNPFGDKSDGGDDSGKGDVEHQILHVLTELLHAVKGGSPLGDPGAGPDLGGPVPPGGDLPDIGAPPAGGPPLPPPVKAKSPVGGPAFAHYDNSKNEFTVLRRDASELGNKAMISEAAELYPTHKVARIQRTGSAKLNGIEVNLPAQNFAVVTLIRQ